MGSSWDLKSEWGGGASMIWVFWTLVVLPVDQDWFWVQEIEILLSFCNCVSGSW